MNSTNLPVQFTSFIGREGDLADVERLLSEANQVTLVGPGGCGKTRLAIQVVANINGLFKDGVWWLDLAPISDPALIPQLVVHSFGIRPAADQPLLESLVNYVRSKEMLLVLDNCEHLIEACAQVVRQLLTAAPELRILATSREALGNKGETLYLVSGLARPALDRERLQTGQRDLVLQELQGFDAVKLFVVRAQSVVPGFTLTHENAPAVVEICQRLDGLPLALELASARVNVLTTHEIATHMHDRLNLLTSGKRRSFEPRHQSLRAAMDWSYTLLTPEEQTLLGRLAVFAAGCSLDTAEGVCSGGRITPGQVLDLLSSLVDKSLILAKTTGITTARYYMLETIRAYALEKLDEAGEGSLVRNRHLELFLTRAEDALPKQFEAYQQLWLTWLETEHDNLRAALSWALESKQIEPGLRLASALTYFWEIHGDVQEGLRWMERLLAGVDESVSLEVHVNALVFSTFQYMLLGNVQAATTCAREAVELAEAVGDANSPILAFAMDGLASAAKTAGDYQTAYDISEKNILYYRAAGPAFYLGMTLLSQGENAIQLGQYAIARERLSESLALARREGDSFRMAHSLNTLGDLARLEGQYGEAASAYEQGAALLRELAAQRDLASLLSNLGFARLFLGDVERAYTLFGESLAIHQAQQNKPGIFECLVGFAATLIQDGQPVAGVRLLAAATALSRQSNGSKWKATQMEFARYLSLAYEMIGKAGVHAEQIVGRTLTLEQALEYARQSQANPRTGYHSGDSVRSLTQREREIAVLIARGKTNREIAEELVLSKRTVEKHAANILSKLELTNRAQIVRWAIEKGLVQASE